MTEEDIQNKIDGYTELLNEIMPCQWNIIITDTLNLGNSKFYSIPTDIITKEEILYRIFKRIDILNRELLSTSLNLK